MFNRYRFKSESGVTLIELLIVMGLISVLAGGVIMLFNPKEQIGKANDAKRKSDLVQLQRALETYYQDYGRYPASTLGTYRITGTTWGGVWSQYMQKLPSDPVSPRTYVYYTPNSGACSNYQCYYLFANLERGGNDPQACNPGTGAACGQAVTTCGGASYLCNYGVSSSNVRP